MIFRTVTFQKTLILVLAAARTSPYVDEIGSSDLAHKFFLVIVLAFIVQSLTLNLGYF
jgi:hypothetical protein